MDNPHADPEEIFHRARGLDDPRERDAYLQRACGGDAVLRGRVKALLRAEAEAGGFLKTAEGPGAGDPTRADPRGERPGEMIGRYKLLQLIGEGGFGSVWMAEQREPVKRRVALKIIKLGMDTKQVIARFEAERQALAMMDHPNIARVLDAGATDTGRPYFVMEYIRGVPILEYCDTERLDTAARLELFISVCHAIQHAHQKGIIHRDIKPGNVLITLHDGVPVAKVIDFGIAKATSAELTTRTLFTQHRQMIGTPAYMSPEQAEMSGLDVDTRADIYSLGVLLYELLTGATPFDPAELMSKGFAEMMRIIREVEPDRPSTRLSTLGETATRTAELRRAGDPRKLGTLLRGDLDWIVMKCLEKDRSRRYETANGLAADIRRHLDDEPVLASPPSAAYRLRKLVRRNRGPFFAAAVVFLVLTLGMAGTTLGMMRAMGAETRAERELARAVEIKRLITEMLESIDPAVAQTSDTTLLRAILAGASERLDRGEIKDELVAADLHRVIGSLYGQLARYEDGERHLLLAAEIHERLLGGSAFETRASQWALAMLYMDSGRSREAEAIFTPMREDAMRLGGEEHPQVLRLNTNLARAYADQSRYVEAEELYLLTLELKKRVLGVEHPDTLKCMNNLASLYWFLGRYAEAEPLMEQTLEIRERTHGPEHPETLTATGNLANLRSEQGRLDEAETMYLRTIPLMRRVLGDNHPSTTRCLGNLAALYLARGRFHDAEPLMNEVLERRRNTLGPDNEDTLGAISDLGTLYNRMGQYGKAREMFELCLPSMRRVLGERHRWTRFALEGLSRAHAGLGEHEDALRLHMELDRIDLELAMRPDAPARDLNEQAWHMLICSYPQLRDPAGALPLAERACALEEAAGGGNLRVYLDTLALAQHMTGDSSAALDTQRRALELMPPDASDPEMLARLAEYEAAAAASPPATAAGGEDR